MTDFKLSQSFGTRRQHRDRLAGNAFKRPHHPRRPSSAVASWRGCSMNLKLRIRRCHAPTLNVCYPSARCRRALAIWATELSFGTGFIGSLVGLTATSNQNSKTLSRSRGGINHRWKTHQCRPNLRCARLCLCAASSQENAH